MNKRPFTKTRLVGGCLGLVLVANSLPVFGCGGSTASSSIFDVAVGDTSVSAVGRSARASTNIGGVTIDGSNQRVGMNQWYQVRQHNVELCGQAVNKHELLDGRIRDGIATH